MRLRNSMWHGLRNDIIMRSIIIMCRMTQRNKLNWKGRPFWRQSICKSSRFFNVADSHKHSTCLYQFSGMTAQILVVLHHESQPLKKNYFGTPFCLNFFLPNTFARLTLQVFFFTFICIRNRARSVSFSDGGFCDRDIIQRSNVSFILALETNRSNS